MPSSNTDQTVPSFPITEGCGTRFLLTIWVAEGHWHARAELLDGSKHVFDSPFELARFVGQAQTPARPTPDPHTGSGLR